MTTSAGSQSFSLSGTGQLPPPKLTVDKTSVAFGGAVTGSHTTTAVKYTNTGGQTLTISAVHAPAAPFSLSGAPAVNSTIAPGSSITVTVKYDPTVAGSFSDAVGVDSDGGSVSTSLSGSAVTPGALQVTPTSIDFGNVVVGDTPTNSFMVKNTGGTTVTITASTPPSGHGFAATTTLNKNATIAPGATATESVTFAPAGTGAAGDAWSIAGDDGTGTHTVSLSGAGVPLLGGSGLAFGTTTVGQTSSPQTLTVRANKALTVQSVATTGPFSTGTPSQSLPTTLAKGATISVPVTYSPSAAGSQSGHVTVTTSAGAQSFSMSGTGQLPPPKLTVDQSTLAFGTVVIGSPVTQPITLTNTGGQPLTLSAVSLPTAPFTATDTPATGAQIAAGDSLTVHVRFDPSSAVPYADALEFDSDGGHVAVDLSGSGESPTVSSTTSTSQTESLTHTSTSTSTTMTSTTTSSSTTHRPTAAVPAAPKLLPAIVTTTQVSSIYISYAATAVANAKFTLQRVTGGRLARVTHGRKLTRSCVPATGSVPRSERCTRYVTVATFSHRDRVGKTKIRVTANVSWRKLVPGIYRLSSVLFDTAGARHTFYATLRINIPPPKHPPRHRARR